MNSALHQRILQENLNQAVCKLNLKLSWVVLKNNNPLREENFFKRSNRSPELYSDEKLWQDLKCTSHALTPTNVTEQERAKILPYK